MLKACQVALALLLFQACAHAQTTQKRVLFIGSSTVERWATLARDFPLVSTKNLGKGGTQYPYLLENAKAWAAQSPSDEIVIYSGDNDIASGVSAETIAENFKFLALILHTELPFAKVDVISIKPCPRPERRARLSEVIKANQEIAAAASELSYARYVNVFQEMLGADGEPRKELFLPDQIHLNPKGYALWTRILAPYVNESR